MVAAERQIRQAGTAGEIRAAHGARIAGGIALSYVSRMDLHAIRNLVQISDTFATAGQPTETQLRGLKELGFDVVVNLGLLDPRYCLPDEAASVAAMGLVYHHIPVDFQTPLRSDFDRFRAEPPRAAPNECLQRRAAAQLAGSSFGEPAVR